MTMAIRMRRTSPAPIPCGSLWLEVAGAEACLRASGALWLEEAGVLAAGDLHLEKGSAFAARGQLLPPYDTAATLDRLSGLFQGLPVDKAPFVNPPTGHEAAGVHWLKPRLVAEVKFAQWTEDGIIRHSAFIGLRDDKRPREVRRETPQPVKALMPDDAAPQRRARRAA